MLFIVIDCVFELILNVYLHVGRHSSRRCQIVGWLMTDCTD